METVVNFFNFKIRLGFVLILLFFCSSCDKKICNYSSDTEFKTLEFRNIYQFCDENDFLQFDIVYDGILPDPRHAYHLYSDYIFLNAEFLSKEKIDSIGIKFHYKNEKFNNNVPYQLILDANNKRSPNFTLTEEIKLLEYVLNNFSSNDIIILNDCLSTLYSVVEGYYDLGGLEVRLDDLDFYFVFMNLYKDYLENPKKSKYLYIMNDLKIVVQEFIDNKRPGIEYLDVEVISKIDHILSFCPKGLEKEEYWLK